MATIITVLRVAAEQQEVLASAKIWSFINALNAYCAKPCSALILHRYYFNTFPPKPLKEESEELAQATQLNSDKGQRVVQ